MIIKNSRKPTLRAALLWTLRCAFFIKTFLLTGFFLVNLYIF